MHRLQAAKTRAQVSIRVDLFEQYPALFHLQQQPRGERRMTLKKLGKCAGRAATAAFTAHHNSTQPDVVGDPYIPDQRTKAKWSAIGMGRQGPSEQTIKLPSVNSR